MSNSIVVVGSCMIDFISYTPKLPKAGETIHGTKFETGFGGKGANQCVAAAKLGGNTTFIARLGNDTWGHDYLKSLNKLQVNTTNVKIMEGNSSGIAQICVDEKGENQIVIVAGANDNLSPQDVDEAKYAIENAAVLVCQLETPQESTIKAMELCQGISILNGAPAISQCDPRLYSLPSIFCINETEAAIFTNHPVHSMSEAKKAVITLLDWGCKTVILTMGAEGALVASKEIPEPMHVTTQKVTPLDTTGAGDAFTGALAYLLAERKDLTLVQCTEVACHLASVSVTKAGTQTSFPDASSLQLCMKDLEIA